MEYDPRVHTTDASCGAVAGENTCLEVNRKNVQRLKRGRYIMDFNKLTQKSQEAIQSAQTKALRYGHVEIDAEHLLLALLEQPDGLIPRLLTLMEVAVEALCQALDQELVGRRRTSWPGVAAE